MTRAELARLVRFRTKTDTNTFSDSDMLFLANTFLYEFAKSINDANEDLFGSISTTNLVIDQREYTLPTDLLNKMKLIEVKFSSTGRWIRLKEFDLNNYSKPTSEEDIIANFANEENKCFYDIFRNSFFIYSGEISENINDGIKLYSFSEPDVFPDITDSSVDMSIDASATGHGLPKTFHELLARRLQIEFKNSQQQPIPLNESEQRFDIDFAIAINAIKNKNKDRTVAGLVPLIHSNGYPTSESITNIDNGYNL